MEENECDLDAAMDEIDMMMSATNSHLKMFAVETASRLPNICSAEHLCNEAKYIYDFIKDEDE